MKKFLIIGLTIIMFFFKNQATADYEKVFFDFKIDSISGEEIDFQEYRNKVILLVNTASYLRLNMIIYKNCGTNIKMMD